MKGLFLSTSFQQLTTEQNLFSSKTLSRLSLSKPEWFENHYVCFSYNLSFYGVLGYQQINSYLIRKTATPSLLGVPANAKLTILNFSIRDISILKVLIFLT